MGCGFLTRRVFGGIVAVGLSAAVVLAWAPVKLAARVSMVRQASSQAAGTEKKRTAGESFKNVQILKDIPAEQLLPSMRYMTAALGVRCDYCHEAERFDSDNKPTKQRAREMMKMMFAIDADNFGERRAVTCYTCHRGAAKPVSFPALSSATIAAPGVLAAQGAKAAAPGALSEPSTNSTTGATGSLPDVDDIFAKYIEAIGGTKAIQASKTRLEKGTVEGPHVVHGTMETFRLAPNKAFAVLHTASGDTMEGVNGASGWGRRPNGELTEEAGDELARSKQWAEFFPGEMFKQDYARFQVRGSERIEGHESFVVMAWWPGGAADQIYFDAQSGLLLRITHQIESPLGSLPLETDYSDYRDVSGLKIPFLVRVTRIDGTTTYTWQQMDANVPVAESRFEKPAPENPAQKNSRP
jgi:photosynthetic reaction center cytochrome c subunit